MRDAAPPASKLVWPERSGKDQAVNYEEAEALLSRLSLDQRNTLEEAHWRYMCFAGVTSIDEASDKQADEDRVTYAHLLESTDDMLPRVSDVRIADFMVAVSGLPREWCQAWDEHDFYETHGVTWAEAADRGRV